MKKVLLLILLIACGASAYWLYDVINAPIVFDNEVNRRSEAVIERIKDVRTAQRAYRKEKGHFAPSFDSLINFVKTDSITFEIKMGSADDDLAVKEGRVKTIKVLIAAKDTLFGKRSVNIDDLRFIPFSDGKEYAMATIILETGAQGVKVPVLSVSAEYKTYLSNLNKNQELVNMYDYDETIGKFPGIKVGSLEKATNEAGNWEN